MKSFIIFFILIHATVIRADLYWGDVVGADQLDLEKADLSRPVGAYKKLMEWKLPRLENSDIYQCLIYKVPHPNEEGVFFLRAFHQQGCQIGGHFQEKILMKTSAKVMLKPHSDYSGLHLQIVDGPRILRLTFPQVGKIKRWKTLHFSKNEQPQKSQVQLEEGEYCLKWNKFCQKVVDNQCSQCPDGLWSETLNYKECPSKVTAICGARSCGRKNQVACLKMVSLKYPLSCEEALHYVVCAPMLIPHCEGTGEIICR